MDGQHPAVALTSQVTRLLDAAGELPLLGLSGPQVDMLIEEQLTVISRLQTMLADVVEQAAVLDRPALLAAPSMVAWLRGRFGLTPASAHRIMREVAALRAAPVAAEAARFGAISLEAAAAIGDAVAGLPDEVGPELRREGAAVLLGFAVGSDGPALDAYELRLAGRHLHEVLDPDAADQLLAQRLEREERAVYRRRFLSITDDHDSGGVRLRGLLTAEAGAILRAVLGPLAAPRPASAATKLGDLGTPRRTGRPQTAGAAPSARPGSARPAGTRPSAASRICRCPMSAAAGSGSWTPSTRPAGCCSRAATCPPLAGTGRSCSSPSTTLNSSRVSGSGPCRTATSSPRRRSAGSPAMRNSSPRSSAPEVNPSTWAAAPGQRPEPNAEP